MSEAGKYAAVEAMRDGRQFQLRALRPDDQVGLLAAVDRSSPQSRYRRFFAPKRGFTEKEIAFFMNVDFVNHVALVALVEESGRTVIVGGGRYFVLQPGRAEVAFTVVDGYQGQGIGAALMRHLVEIARGTGIKELVAEVLHENVAMLGVFQKSGLQVRKKLESGVVHVTIQLFGSAGGCGPSQ